MSELRDTFTAEGVTIGIRDYCEKTDRGYVISTWITSHRDGSPIPRHLHAAHHDKVVEIILSRPTVKLRMACSVEHPTTLCGWVCVEDRHVHYAYVPHTMRGVGIARALIRNALGGYPQNIDVTSFVRRHPRYKYNPYILGLFT